MGETTPTTASAVAAGETSTEQLLSTLQALAARIDALEQQVGTLESELAEARASIPIPEETVLAISAAVAAFLGHKAKLKQIHYRTGAAWAQQGRVAVQGRSVMHGVR